MAFSDYLISAGGGSIHRFRITNNGEELESEIFYFSGKSAGCVEKTIKQNSWNAVENQLHLSLPAISSKQNWTLLDARNVTEISSGKNIVCALISSSKKNKFRLLIVTTSSCDDKLKLVPLKYVEVDKQTLELSSFETCKPRLIDGPGILWVHKSALHVATSSYEPTNRLHLKSFSLDDDINNKKSKQTHFSTLFYNYFRGMSLVVGTKIKDDKQGKTKTPFAVMFPIPLDTFKKVDINRILPEPYASTAQHVKVLPFSYSQDDVFSGENSLLNIRLLAVTSGNYLTEFHSGKLIRCLYIPSIQLGISQLTAIPTPEGSTSCFPVIITDEKKVRVITPQLTKVHSILEGYSNAFVDDFMDWGSSQLFLLQLHTTIEPNVLSNHWLLTDFDACQFVSEPNIFLKEDDGDQSRMDTDECSEAVEKALGNKIQLEILAMEEKARLLKIQNDFIMDCRQRLLSMQTTEWKPYPLTTDKKPGLITFLEGSTHKALSAKQTLSSGSLEIIRLWQKIYGGQWIVGVVFKHSKPKSLKKASLLLNASIENDISKPGTNSDHANTEPFGNSTLSGQSIFWGNTTSSSIKDQFTVTCTLHSLPLVTVHPTRKFLVHLCLHTIHGELQNSLQISTYPCGIIDFGIEQLICANFDGSSLMQSDSTIQSNELEDSICVLNAVQCNCKVHVRSKKSELTFLEEYLKSAEELSWNPFLKCFLWRSNSGLLTHTRLIINKAQPHDCLLSIFTREVSCIPAIVHFLYSRLPEDVVILPEMSISMSKVSTWLQQLQSYLLNLSKVFCLLEDQGMSIEGQLAPDATDQLTANLLDQIRYECDTKKRKIADRHLVDLSKCQMLINLLEKQKLHLDSLAVIFFNKNIFPC